MAKLSKEEVWRREGMTYALKVAKEKGVAGLEEELRFRNATQLPISVNRSACDEMIIKIKENTIDTVVMMAISAMHDEFGFGEKRVQKFLDRFEEKTAYMIDGYYTWDELRTNIKDELGIELTIRENNTDVRG